MSFGLKTTRVTRRGASRKSLSLYFMKMFQNPELFPTQVSLSSEQSTLAIALCSSLLHSPIAIYREDHKVVAFFANKKPFKL
jgi:hypothetical protein